MKLIGGLIVALVLLVSPCLADVVLTGYTVKSVQISGESGIFVTLQNGGSTTKVSALVGQGFNGVSFTTGEVKQYAALFLTAFSTGSKVDVSVDYTSWGGGYLIHSATVSN
jgi:hypothetical protein